MDRRELMILLAGACLAVDVIYAAAILRSKSGAAPLFPCSGGSFTQPNPAPAISPFPGYYCGSHDCEIHATPGIAAP